MIGERRAKGSKSVKCNLFIVLKLLVLLTMLPLSDLLKKIVLRVNRFTIKMIVEIIKNLETILFLDLTQLATLCVVYHT